MRRWQARCTTRRGRQLFRRWAAIAVSVAACAVANVHAVDVPSVPLLSLSLSAESSGATENVARLQSNEYLLLLRARSAGGGPPEYSGGVESPVLSLGSLSARGLERTLERPLRLGALSDGRLLAGGYRLRRSGGYGELPDAAVRVGPAAAFRRSTERFASVGVSFAAAFAGGVARPSVVRLLAARSVPTVAPEESDWILDRPEPSGGPLWYFGVEAVGPSGYAGLVLSAGDTVRSSVLGVGVGDVRIGPADLRAMLGGVSGEFVGSDGIPASTDALGGLRVSLPRGRLVRPLARSELRLRAAAIMPRQVIPRSSDSRMGIELGPESLFVQPGWRIRTDLSAERVKRVRHDVSVRLRIAGGRSRSDISARRGFDDGEAGFLEARIGTRFTLGVARRGTGGANLPAAANDAPETDITLEASGTVTRRDLRPGDVAFIPDDAEEPQMSGRLRISMAGERLEAGMRIDIADRGIPVSRFSEILSSPLAWSAGTIFVRLESEFGMFRAGDPGR